MENAAARNAASGELSTRPHASFHRALSQLIAAAMAVSPFALAFAFARFSITASTQGLAALGHNRKSVAATRMSVVGVSADVARRWPELRLLAVTRLSAHLGTGPLCD